MLDKNILLVEDDPITRAMMKAIMKGKVNLLEAENGKVGLELLQDHDVAAVILDLNMPVMDGYGFLKQLGDIGIDNMPSVFVTSCNFESDFYLNAAQQKIDLTPVKRYYQKPVSLDELMGELRLL